MSISTKPALVDRLFFSRRAGRTAQRRAPLQSLGTVEGLEPRWLPSVATPAIQMLSATTTDSKSVTIEYQVNQAPTTATPLQFGVYRSSDGQFNSRLRGRYGHLGSPGLLDHADARLERSARHRHRHPPAHHFVAGGLASIS